MSRSEVHGLDRIAFSSGSSASRRFASSSVQPYCVRTMACGFEDVVFERRVEEKVHAILLFKLIGMGRWLRH